LFNIVLSHTYKYVCKLAWPRVSFICRWGIVGGAKIGGKKELRGGLVYLAIFPLSCCAFRFLWFSLSRHSCHRLPPTFGEMGESSSRI